MTSRTHSSAYAPSPARKALVSLGVFFALLAAVANVAHRAVSGHGHWHQAARQLYLQWKPAHLSAVSLPAERADSPMLIYGDKLGDGWADWSWSARDLNWTADVHSGHAAIRMIPNNWQGLYLHHDSFGTGGYGTLQVWVKGDPAELNVTLPGSGGNWGPKPSLAKYCAPGSGWRLALIPLADLGAPRSGESIGGVVFQTAGASTQAPILLDDMALLPDLSLPPAPTTATVGVTISADIDLHPISPYLYGMAFAPPDYLSDLRLPLNRWGGNDKSRYNWVQGNTESAARDWEYRNRVVTVDGTLNGPSSAADRFFEQNKAGGAATLLTLPTLGWVARNTDNNTRSQNIPGSSGPPLTTADGAIAGYDPAANRTATCVRSVARKNAPFTNTPLAASEVVYQDEWVHHLTTKYGTAAHGGIQFFAMDNEPDIWDYTHLDVHPARMGYDDMLQNFLEYATAVKAVDPTTLITGPVLSGWTGMTYSALDRGDDNFHTFADRKRHSDLPFTLWFLQQVHAHDVRTGQRSLDVLDIHYYPQAQNIYSNAVDKETAARRLRTTRSLWDPTYPDESWIGDPVRLIPRLKGWIAQGYPGTRIGITEWNFGADSMINGGLTIADVLGIYGREGVYLANYWAFPPKNSPGYLAFKLYRNADGQGHGFGDLSCRAVSVDQGKLSAYAATDSKTGDLTVVLINKMFKATVTAPLTIMGMTPIPNNGGIGGRRVKMWRCDADNPGMISAFPARPISGGALTVILPPQSMTLMRISGE